MEGVVVLDLAVFIKYDRVIVARAIYDTSVAIEDDIMKLRIPIIIQKTITRALKNDGRSASIES